MAGLSAAELGRLSGLSRTVVQMIESGARSNPVSTTVAQLAGTLGDDGSYLLGLGGKPSKRAVLAAVTKAKMKIGGTPGAIRSRAPG